MRPQHCITCTHWVSRGEIENPHYPDPLDIASGQCLHNGYSHVPPCFCCNSWREEYLSPIAITYKGTN